MIEEIKNIKSTKKDIRQCILIMGIGYLVIISIINFFTPKEVGLKFFIAGIIFILSGQAFPSVFKPVQKLWMSLGIIMGSIIGPIFLTLIYCMAIAPIGIIARIIKKDILDQRIDKKRPSYWHERGSGPKSKESYENQY